MKLDAEIPKILEARVAAGGGRQARDPPDRWQVGAVTIGAMSFRGDDESPDGRCRVCGRTMPPFENGITSYRSGVPVSWPTQPLSRSVAVGKSGRSWRSSSSSSRARSSRLPWAVPIPAVRRLAVAKANGLLAPSKVEVGSLHLSWFGDTRMSRVKLFDPKGHCVVDAPHASLDRSVWQLLFDRPDYGTLTLHEAAVDIERRADGSIDLADALQPILASDPKSESDPRTDFTLKIHRGKLRLRSPELVEPLTAERMDMVLQAPPAPKGLAWQIELANPKAPGTETLTIEGQYDHRAPTGTPAELKMNVAGVRWRVAAQTSGLVMRGRFDGKVDVVQHDGSGASRATLACWSSTRPGPPWRGIGCVSTSSRRDGTWPRRRKGGPSAASI